MNLNTPTIHAGPLTAADLDAARKHSTGTVLPDACAEEGGIHREPSRTVKESPLLGVLLVLSGWPLVAVLVALVVFFVEHMPRIN